jgi:hypothetical protein
MTEAPLFHRCRKALGLSTGKMTRVLLIAGDRQHQALGRRASPGFRLGLGGARRGAARQGRDGARRSRFRSHRATLAAVNPLLQQRDKSPGRFARALLVNDFLCRMIEFLMAWPEPPTRNDGAGYYSGRVSPLF